MPVPNPVAAAAAAPAARPSAMQSCSAKLPLAAPTERSRCADLCGMKAAIRSSKSNLPWDWLKSAQQGPAA
jgi:hypothetical protein